MKRLLLIGLLSLFFLPMNLQADDSCGDQGVTCGDQERCCEHEVAKFSVDQSVGPAYIEGQCIPKEEKCEAFSCGNRLCKSSFFSSPSVCCVNTREGAMPEYSCASNEYACPGSSEQLTIRPQTGRPLRRG